VIVPQLFGVSVALPGVVCPSRRKLYILIAVAMIMINGVIDVRLTVDG